MRMTKWGAVLGAALVVGLAAGAMAQGPKFFRIGTGGTAGTYYPVGGIIANAISNPPNLVSTAVASNGSVANVNAIVGGQMESGFTQSDVAYWAYTGTGVFEGKPKVAELRAVANLYPESIHLVARKGAGISSVADLKGKRVSIDEPGSGTLVDAKIIMAGWGIKESDIKPEYVKPNQAAEKMKDGALDAFFFVGGFPAAAITELATSGPGIVLVPIDGPNADKIRTEYKFFAPDEVPAGTYKGVEAVKTLSVGAQWVTSAKIDEATVYAVTKGLWSDKARQALDAGHAKGKAIKKENALSGIGIPVHPGAEKFYREIGLIK
ncbi:MAG: TAXI family TRAP transporter solute-binding subunit [Variibacter sp.]